MPSLHTNTGAKRAREARIARDINPTTPLHDLLTTTEATAPVILNNFPPDFAGAIIRRDSSNLIFVNAAHSHVRQRFTLAHELGHICCGHDTDTIVDTVAMVSGGDTSNVEVQANSFAAEFLVPKAGLEHVEGEPDLERIVRLACEFGVSAIMMLYRFNTLGLVSEKRSARLKAEIDEGHHETLADHLGLEQKQDRLAALTEDDLPYASPSLAGKSLGALLSGKVSLEAAARAAGTTGTRLQIALGG